MATLGFEGKCNKVHTIEYILHSLPAKFLKCESLGESVNHRLHPIEKYLKLLIYSSLCCVHKMAFFQQPEDVEVLRQNKN